MTSALFTVHGQTWFTADLHLGHERIIELCARPFASVAEMNTALIENWNSRVEERDTVWVLGDVALGPIEESLALIGQLNGYKILIAGNHDRCFAGFASHKTRSAVSEWADRYRTAGFAGVVTGSGIARSGNPIYHALRRTFGGAVAERVVLSHFPRTGESRPGHPDRYSDYRPRPHRGRTPEPWVIHGHVHNRWTVHGRQINVGVDVWDFAPVHADTLAEIIEKGLPACACRAEGHLAGAPGCVINGGPDVD